MKRYFSNFIKFIPLLKELVSRDIKIKYRKSVLGVLWTLLNPLFMMIILSVVFSNIFKFDVDNFPLYLLSGQVIFNFFSDATSGSMTAIIESAPLIKKIYIPKYLFVVSKVISSTINLLASFTALIFVMLATRAPLYWTVFLVFIPLLYVVFFSLGIGLILSTVAVKFRDVVHLYSVFLTGLLYLTPIIYPINILPNTILKIVMLNPITNFVIIFRDVIMYNTIPTNGSVFIATIETFIVCVLGVSVFLKNQDQFILYI